jgi:hypothetical protein
VSVGQAALSVTFRANVTRRRPKMIENWHLAVKSTDFDESSRTVTPNGSGWPA